MLYIYKLKYILFHAINKITEILSYYFEFFNFIIKTMFTQTRSSVVNKMLIKFLDFKIKAYLKKIIT